MPRRKPGAALAAVEADEPEVVAQALACESFFSSPLNLNLGGQFNYGDGRAPGLEDAPFQYDRDRHVRRGQSDRASPRRDRVAELHRRFHVAAARLLDVALAGKKREALKMLDGSGEYAGVSSALMREMTEWQREADYRRR